MTGNSNTELVAAFSTAGSPEEARRIATALVTERLAACINIVDDIHSIYRWQGAIESAAESLMLIKTRANLVPAIEMRLRELHSYDAPELVAIPTNLISIGSLPPPAILKNLPESLRSTSIEKGKKAMVAPARSIAR
jgi:periplasmic divalent cation tolerance protein